MQKRIALSFPEEVLEHVFSFIQLDKDRNSVSLVCKSWYEIERWCRRKVFIGNCYAVSPATVIRRFPKVRSVELKGKPHFADFNLVPDGWGGYVYPWIEAMSSSYTWLEEIRLKRMVVTDDCLELIAKSFKNFKVLVLSSCEGFSTDGLAAIAATCRNLKELDLRESDVDEVSGHWLSHFPDTYTSLVSLNISCLASEVSFSALERLVTRCPNLKSLKLNRAVPLEKLATLLQRAPQLEELGTGGYTAEVRPDVYSGLSVALSGCKELRCLSGFWDAVPAYLPAVYSVCSRLTTLNLSYATVQSYDLVKLLCQCPKLQRLWVLDYIEDAGLEVLASTCKDLRELRVFPSEPFVMEPNVALTEQGLVSVSMGCPKLESVLYFCRQMTNAALITIARNRPNMTRFRLCIIEPKAPDYLTLEPLDIGFGAIVEHCKDLRRLSLSGLLTDKVFEYIGTYAKKMEMLSVAFAGDSDLGLHHVLSGCDSLRKLEIRDCPFGDKALLANASKLETMRSLWMSSCSVSFGACKLLGQKMPKLNVEVIDERGAPDSRPESCPVERVFIYRTVAGPRFDMPGFVWNMDQDSTMRFSRQIITTNGLGGGGSPVKQTLNFDLLKLAGDVESNPGPMVSELIKENMHMKLYMEGTVDNHHFKCTSEGEGKPYEGTQTMRIKVVEGGPLPFAFDILATSFLYGSKTFINHTQGIPDFFKQSFPEGFTWERVTTYEDGGVLTATQDTSLQDGCLIYNVKIRGVNFTSNGPVMQKKTLGWEAFTETLYPADGGLEGRNDMALKLVGGSHLIANAKTTYRSKKPAKNLKMPGVYYVDYRLERIKEANNETYVEQHEVAVARYCDLPSKLGHKLNPKDPAKPPAKAQVVGWPPETMAKSKAEIQKEERDNRYERRLLEKRKRHEIDNKASTSSSMASAAPAPPMKNGRTRKQQKLQNLALAREKQRIKRAAAKHVRNNDNNQVDNEADRIDEGAANSDAGKIGLFQKTACNLAEHN